MTLDEKTRALIRQFKPNTPIMSQSGGHIGHVVRYFQFGGKDNRVYQVYVQWADSDNLTIVDFDDIQLL